MSVGRAAEIPQCRKRDHKEWHPRRNSCWMQKYLCCSTQLGPLAIAVQEVYPTHSDRLRAQLCEQ